MHRGFGDAVHVDQLRRTIAEALEPRAQAADLQRLAAKYHAAQLLVTALASAQATCISWRNADGVWLSTVTRCSHSNW